MNLLHYPDPYSVQAVIFLIAACILAIPLLISIHCSKVTFAILSIILVIGCAIASITFSNKSKDANIEHLQSWLKNNYSLTLNHHDAAELFRKRSLIAEKNDAVEKIELERYKDGYLLFNDGKAIKQEN